MSFSTAGRGLIAVLALLVIVCPAAAITVPKTAADLAGLWQAKRRFGPDLRGPVVVEQGTEGWKAEAGGRSAPGKVGRTDILFDFGPSAGSLRVEPGPARGAARAWWVQPANSFNSHGHATPVALTRDAGGRWRGFIAPLDDQMTFYMPVTAAPDGGASAFLRNPERNVGYFMDVDRLVLDGAGVALWGHPSHSRDEKLVARGAYDPDNDLLSLYLPDGGGTFDFSRVKPGEASDFYPRGYPTIAYRYGVPTPRDDGWPVASLDDVGLSRAALERFIQLVIDTPMSSVHASDIQGVLIARHGKLVLEEYFHGFSRDRLHDLRSAAKSFTATLAGAVILSGRTAFDTTTPVYAAMNAGAAPALLEPRKRAMTVEHLLTMSAGFFCDDNNPAAPGGEDTMQAQTAEPDWYRFTLALPMASDPGAVSVYCSSEPNLLGGVINRTTGRPLTDLFRDRVAEPLGMKRYALNLQPTGEPYMGGGVYVEPRDFLKLGQMMLNGGVWNGRRVVSTAWVVRAGAPLHPLRGISYGYLWWVTDYPFKGRKVRAFFAGGNGGQIVMVVPELDLVIEFLGGNYSDRVLYIPQREYVPNDILPAVEDGK